MIPDNVLRRNILPLTAISRNINFWGNFNTVNPYIFFLFCNFATMKDIFYKKPALKLMAGLEIKFQQRILKSFHSQFKLNHL